MSDPVILPASDKWTVSPEGHEVGIRVTLSHPVGAPSGPVPLLVLLDGDTMFLTATEFARTVNLVTMGTFPPVAIVGLMRDEKDHAKYIATRFRDFTPNEWSLSGPFEQDNAMMSLGSGRAGEFLAAIENDVLPQVRERLTTAGFTAGDTAIGGWSLSGLFACWAWLTRPNLFPHALAITPSLWWNDASLLASPLAQKTNDQRLFICAGEHEEGDPAHFYPPQFANPPQNEMAAMVRNAETFAQLASIAGANVDHVTVTGEHHVTVQSAAMARGLRHLFG